MRMAVCRLLQGAGASGIGRLENRLEEPSASAVLHGVMLRAGE